jgi:hypothetical protein
VKECARRHRRGLLRPLRVLVLSLDALVGSRHALSSIGLMRTSWKGRVKRRRGCERLRRQLTPAEA